ncbi:cellulase family glycosylhydrolase [Natronospora cellulosivora (SeqCode)]
MKRTNLSLLIVISLFLVFSVSVMAVTFGDVNEDGVIDSRDYVLLTRYIMDIPVDINVAAARLNGDTYVSSLDATLLGRYLLDMIDSFPAEDNAVSADGFYVEDSKIYDANGNEFIMRGLSFPHTWFDWHQDVPEAALEAIAGLGVNSVRVVLSNGAHAGAWGRDSAESVANIIEVSKANNMIPILEIHDCTGYGEDNDAAHISTAVDYWIDIADVLKGQEEYVIINIANEPFGNNVAADDYVNDHIEAIQRLRENGFKHALMIDAANWGQDWERIMLNRAPEIFAADPDENTIFSIHMYQVYSSPWDVDNYLDEFAQHNLPLVIGEFGHAHYGENVAHERIMERAQQDGLGYIGWSWYGNNSPVEDLDMSYDWLGENLTPWGEEFFFGPNGIQETSEICTIFTQ